MTNFEPPEPTPKENLLLPNDLGDDLSTPLSIGCIFCRTGYEKSLAHSLNNQYGDSIWTVAISLLKHKSTAGVKSVDEHILFPGYLFFRSYDETPPLHELQATQGIIKILQNSSNDWRLTGTDKQFAEWVFRLGGLVGISTAYKDGDRVRIQSGPLKDLEGSIIKIDRRSRNGLVDIYYNGQNRRIWLAFELVEHTLPSQTL